ncbi:MAG: hypothetical protein WHV44_13920, partial [Anaerolineales bacterium]
CGLLPGVLRAELLAQGKIEEHILRPDDLPACGRIYRINALRGWQEVTLPTPPAPARAEFPPTCP